MTAKGNAGKGRPSKEYVLYRALKEKAEELFPNPLPSGLIRGETNHLADTLRTKTNLYRYKEILDDTLEQLVEDKILTKKSYGAVFDDIYILNAPEPVTSTEEAIQAIEEVPREWIMERIVVQLKYLSESLPGNRKPEDHLKLRDDRAALIQAIFDDDTDGLENTIEKLKKRTKAYTEYLDRMYYIQKVCNQEFNEDEREALAQWVRTKDLE